MTRQGIDQVESATNLPANEGHGRTMIQNNFYSDVGVNQSGSHNVAHVHMGAKPGEIIAILGSLRELSSTLPVEVREEALQHIEDLEAEQKAETPKPSRLKATLMALGLYATGAVEFSTKLAELAEKLGIKLG